jgi:hypothetical protein
LISPKRAALLPALTRIQVGLLQHGLGRHHLDRDAGGLGFAFLLGRHVSLVSSCRASCAASCLPTIAVCSAGAPLWRTRTQLRHRHARVAAGVDRGVGREVHVDVERDAVIAAAVLDAQAQRGDLGGADIDAGRALAALGRDARSRPAGRSPPARCDAPGRAPSLAPAQVEQQVDHRLAGAVVGDLAAAVDLHHGDADVGQQVLGLAERPWVNTGGCSQSQSSSGVSAPRAAVNSCIAAKVGA